MANPDNNASIGSSLNTLAFAIIMLIFTIMLFLFRDSFGDLFVFILWIGLPIIGYIISSCGNLVSQYINCKKVDAGKAFLGGLPTIGTTLFALGISSISYCRIPIASVFAPLFVGGSVDVTKKNSNTSINSIKNSKSCCVPKISLESIELKNPIIKGLSYGFYIMFAVFFGSVLGNGISAIC